MFSIVRKVVAGPKNTISYEGEELDLTYITPRVIAMAFPASGMLEKTYRNSIEDVASYLEETHSSHYLVINVSSRSYNYTIFKHKVRDYEWPDHQAPPLSTLVAVAFDMFRHLSSTASSTQPAGGRSWRCTATTARAGPAPPSLPSSSSSASTPQPARACTSTTRKGSASPPTGSTSPANFATSSSYRR